MADDGKDLTEFLSKVDELREIFLYILGIE